MSFAIMPTSDGGRHIGGDTPHGKFAIHIGPRMHGKRIEIFDEDGVTVIGTVEVHIKTPMADHGGKGVNGVIKGIGQGAVGLVKDRANIGIRSEADQQIIFDICEQCDQSLPKELPIEQRRCGKLSDVVNPATPTCGCWISSIARVEGKQCPLGKISVNKDQSKGV